MTTGVRWGLRAFCLTVPLTIAGANISWGLALAGLIAYAASGGKIPRRAWKSRAAVPLFVFLAASVLTAALGVDPARSFRFVYQDAHKVWLYLLFMTAAAVAADDEAPLFLAAGFGAAAAIGIAQAVPPRLKGLVSVVEPWNMVRAHAFVHPVTFGEQMAVAALGAVCFLIAPPAGAGPGMRRAFGVLLGAAAAAMLLSGTRGALIGFFGGLVAVLAMVRRLRRFLLAAILLGISLFGFMELQYPNRSLIRNTARAFASTDPLPQSLLRIQLFRVAWEMGMDHPLTGVGKNNFREELPNYLTMVFEDKTMSWGNAHNLYLHHFAERGLVGLAALMAFLWAFWKRSFDRARTFGDGLNLWAFGTASGFLLMNLTEVALEVEVVWMLVFFVWILAEAAHKRRAEAA